MALTALTLASCFGLTRIFSGGHWSRPVLLTVIAVHACAWASRRGHLGKVAGLAVPAVAGIALLSWTVLGSTTTYGIPTGRTLSAASSALRSANQAISTVSVPVQTTRGFLLAAAGIAGIAALAGDWFAFRWKSGVLGAAPAFALFIAGCSLGAGAGRSWAEALEAAGLLVFIVVHRASVGIGRPWLAGVSKGTLRWALPAGSLLGVTAIAAVAIGAPVTHGPDGRGVLGWHAGGEGGGLREVANPIVDLRTRLVDFADVGVFSAQSAIPSYWRLTSLDTFTGSSWVSTNSYKGFAGRLPGVASVPPGTRTVTESFRVQNLESVWLPAGFTPVRVQGVRGVDYDAASSSLITSKKTSDGLTYTVTSYQFLATLDPTQLRSAPPPRATALTARYLALPASVPQSVYALAQRITTGQRNEYDKALALQNFFQGPRFNYSLDPPADGVGIDTLTNFLFETRTGYCQQFAGAYAVLARAVGLPTRLAVGFTPGSDVGGTFQVLDADAHTWPEVYFGPRLGWLPFEPTKSFSDPSAASYAPVTNSGNQGGSSPGDLLPVAPKGTATTLPAKQSATPPTTAAGKGSGATTGPSSGAGGWAVALVILLLTVGWMTINAGVRRARWAWRRWRSRGDPGSVVLSYWKDTAEVLSWWGVRRLPGDTDHEFAERAAGAVATAVRDPSPWVAGGIRRLATLASQATFARALADSAPAEAAMVAAEVRQRLFRKASSRRLLQWALTQRPGTG